MHKITVWHEDAEFSRHREKGYYVKLNCSLVNGDKLLAILKDPADAIQFANWKGVEMGLTVDLGWQLLEILDVAKKGKKKRKKRRI